MTITKVFMVSFYVTENWPGSSSPFQRDHSMKVSAKSANDAIEKVKKQFMKRVKGGPFRKNFDPYQVLLVAQTDF